MMLVDLHVILTLATHESTFRLMTWREGRELSDYVSIVNHSGIQKLPIRPDAFFTLEDSRRPEGSNRAHFFLEADRSTATQTRFKEKISAYWHYLEQGLHTRKFGIKNFRVLTVTLTDPRAKNLCDLAASLLPVLIKCNCPTLPVHLYLCCWVASLSYCLEIMEEPLPML